MKQRLEKHYKNTRDNPVFERQYNWKFCIIYATIRNLAFYITPCTFAS